MPLADRTAPHRNISAQSCLCYTQEQHVSLIITILHRLQARIQRRLHSKTLNPRELNLA